MNFKTKAIGLLAGSALAVSATSGAMAQNVDSDIELLDGFCIVDVEVADEADTVDFGTWVYDSAVDEWVPAVEEGNPIGFDNIDFEVSDDSPDRVAACDVDVDATALEIDEGTEYIDVTLAAEGLNSSSSSGSDVNAHLDLTLTPNESETINISVDPEEFSAGGEYEGTITVTNNSAEPV